MSIIYKDKEKKTLLNKKNVYHHNIVFPVYNHTVGISPITTSVGGWLWFTKIGKTRFKRRNTDKLTIKTYNILFQRYLIAIIIYLARITWWHVLYHVQRGPHRTRVMVSNLSLYIATIYIIYIIHIMHNI